MEVIRALEEKIKALFVYAQSLKQQLALLQANNDTLTTENEELRAESIRLAENNAQLMTQLNAIENSMLVEIDQVHKLKEEHSVTRLALDDLIKSIDSLVENEK